MVVVVVVVKTVATELEWYCTRKYEGVLAVCHIFFVFCHVLVLPVANISYTCSLAHCCRPWLRSQ